MREIVGRAKTVREMLNGAKYSIDYYQREYKWGEKQVTDLVNDLAAKFLEEFDPSHDRQKISDYPHYFLGSVIISKKSDGSFIVDGQQRLTSLTLLLILLHNLQKRLGEDDRVAVSDLIFSVKYGQKSFNLDVAERTPCLEALFKEENFDISEAPEAVRNLYERYQDIASAFPAELSDDALPFFADWLLENVHLVEITAYSDDDAYTIFETMNDRGLSLRPTDMLKGYLLANIEVSDRASTNERWKERIRAFEDRGKDVDSEFFKAWLRSQYAQKIRERKKGAKQEDFDRIGTEYHRWVRDARNQIELNRPADFKRFLEQDFEFYSKHYLQLLEAARGQVEGLEHVYYNSLSGFTQQFQLLLAPLRVTDSPDEIDRKIRVTAMYVDILLTWRQWNFRRISYSTMQYAMFLVMRDIRGLDTHSLAEVLVEKLRAEEENFDDNHYGWDGVGLYLHQQNRKFIHQFLARITDYMETQSGMTSRFDEFMGYRNVKYEVEHIWADKYERHTDEFDHESDFRDTRNRLGGLLLLPKPFNASYGALPYAEKLPHYASQNLLARSLHSGCYDHNPGFVNFKAREKLSFEPVETFTRKSIDERGELYRKIAKHVWRPEALFEVAQQ
ncbi:MULTISPECIES: DUF262 domain-containing protein [Alphaproteobacteria]|uniref:DUF262 domain-containing protein n=1 Tax=Alphaproteobacteria TaxID=28211 RepID=UPI001B17ED0D|nr:DUF262 domain-containing protein [Maricaulis sp.]MBO6765037.1 DUF262 domain-containing protein [Maricaulis sp.]